MEVCGGGSLDESFDSNSCMYRDSNAKRSRSIGGGLPEAPRAEKEMLDFRLNWATLYVL